MADLHNRSIHPRVENGRTRHPKVNTAKPASRVKLERAAVGMRRHIEANPLDGACKDRLARIEARLRGMSGTDIKAAA